MNRIAAALLTGLLAASGALLAYGSRDPPLQLAQANTEALSEGEVRKVDKAQGKVTLRHGSIANLDMPPMTMVFQAKDPAVLDQLKVGEKVRFRAEKEGSTYVVTRVEKAP
jgi:Cu/Ag efflux protein CusF